jgi:hypothetical protein
VYEQWFLTNIVKHTFCTSVLLEIHNYLLFWIKKRSVFSQQTMKQKQNMVNYFLRQVQRESWKFKKKKRKKKSFCFVCLKMEVLKLLHLLLFLCTKASGKSLSKSFSSKIDTETNYNLIHFDIMLSQFKHDFYCILHIKIWKVFDIKK